VEAETRPTDGVENGSMQELAGCCWSMRAAAYMIVAVQNGVVLAAVVLACDRRAWRRAVGVSETGRGRRPGGAGEKKDGLGLQAR
jgi:hypothetical protein